ncbi:AAA family ATPase [Arthrobacter sp. 2MCAF14]|uniref:AAA family ATPase n=1 Tax=Arthrobacter sp. 2MCAF14 TaxID=3232982 RepID=UPI003F90951A
MQNIGEILANLPCSVEMPAGTGKTETIADLVQAYADQGKHCLVLTHTHAGVDVLRRRLKKRGVASGFYMVRTLDSWCYDLIQSFPIISNIAVGDEPDWDFHRQYHEAGALAVTSGAISKMLRISHDLVIVDEYQDCQVHQHELVAAVSRTVPTVVFGDRMQGLFFWSGNSVIWEEHVVSVFPPVSIEVEPWRWKASNPALGQWLLDARQNLMDGSGIDLTSAPLQVYVDGDEATACFDRPRHPETSVAIARWPKSAAILANRLGGAYTMIEELEGKHLEAFAGIADGGLPRQVAQETLAYALSCSFGVAKYFPVTSRSSLARGVELSPQSFIGAEHAASALNDIIRSPTPFRVRRALQELRSMEGVRLFRREAWSGMIEALRLCEATPGLTVYDAVVQIRSRMSIVGRKAESRIVGRPLLVKGLEFDHAVLTEVDGLNAHELYVALTRGSSTVSMVTNSHSLNPPRPY